MTDQELIERAAAWPDDITDPIRATVRALARELEAFKRAVADDALMMRPLGSPPASAEASPGLRPVETRSLEEAEAGPAGGACPICGHESYLAPDGVQMIANERRRQIEEKGYDAAHDDLHGNCEIVSVAGELVAYVDPRMTMDPQDPWGIIAHTERKFPKHRRANLRLLTIAAALIAAEIDRQLRLESTLAKET